jgi:hypothetical protein
VAPEPVPALARKVPARVPDCGVAAFVGTPIGPGSPWQQPSLDQLHLLRRRAAGSGTRAEAEEVERVNLLVDYETPKGGILTAWSELADRGYL